MAFLLSTPSPKYGLSSPNMAEVLVATMLFLLLRVCAGRLEEKVEASKVDRRRHFWTRLTYLNDWK